MQPSPEIDNLLFLLDQAYDHRAWHGTNLKGSIRGLKPETAVWRPAPGRHNINEIVVHCAYWKYVVLRRLTGEKRGSFPIKGSNWFTRTSTEYWKGDTSLLNEMHKSLLGVVSDLRAKDLPINPAGSKVSNLEIITGIASHDLYHAGQIQLLKRLAAEG